MRQSSLAILILFAFKFGASNVHAGFLDSIFGYDSYEDCILGELEGKETAPVVREKKKACRRKFPEPFTPIISLKKVKVGGLEITNSEWKWNPNRPGSYYDLLLTFRNIQNQPVRYIKVFGHKQSGGWCDRDDALGLGEKSMHVAPGKMAFFKDLWAYDKLNTQKACIWVEGYTFK